MWKREKNQKKTGQEISQISPSPEAGVGDIMDLAGERLGRAFLAPSLDFCTTRALTHSQRWSLRKSIRSPFV